ncbi:MAG: 4Fe-4S dicluster domain-containing protein [Bacteroidetes bacterium]|nr:4Fe-4S dicluster domain-containing protein [Bacteroidota bacterium]
MKKDKWGYGIHPDRQIDLDNANLSLLELVRQSEPSYNLCIACGSCAATCTAGNLTTISLRRINIYLQRGMIKELREEIRRCMLCGKCYLACPRGVNTRHVIIAIHEALKATGYEEL